MKPETSPSATDRPIDPDLIPDNPYLLLTPGPLSTSKSVRATMLRDWCTWDDDYNHGVVQDVRERLVSLATSLPGYTSVLVQSSGTFGVEATVGSVVPEDGKLLVLANGGYGDRIVQIAERLRIANGVLDSGEIAPPDCAALEATLTADPAVTHVAVVHCETTTGILNPLADIAAVVKGCGRTFIVDAMSSFGGIPMDVEALGIDFLVSSANKCIEGVPGFCFVIAREESLERSRGRARSLSLDLHEQWRTMEEGHGKWRYTSPTHVVRAFQQALRELDAEGGVAARHNRYAENQRVLVKGMESLGFRCLLPPQHQSPIITAFFEPDDDAYGFARFYEEIKRQGFVIYPGKVSVADTFRIGTIGQVFPDDVQRLLRAIGAACYWHPEHDDMVSGASD